MAKPVKLSVIRSERQHDAAKSLKRDMYEKIGNQVRDMGDTISGYAFVCWDKTGANSSSYRSGHPVLSRLLPSFASDTLTQHVTIDLAKDSNK